MKLHSYVYRETVCMTFVSEAHLG